MVLCSLVATLQSQPSWVFWLCLFGAVRFLRTFIAALEWVYIYFFRPAKDLKKYGSWAMVTGATDGIGKAVATEIARKGLNVILVGRDPNKLDLVSGSIQLLSKTVKVKTVEVDFTGDLDEGMKKIKEAIKGIDVGILVNNVGMSYPYARFLHEVDEELVKNLIKVNVETTTRITHAVLPTMLKRKRGAIVNVGSGVFSAVSSDPFYSVYAATKAYVDYFSKCLSVEYKNTGIDIQCLIPLFVTTKLSKIKKPTLFVPSPTVFARTFIRQIGYDTRCPPYWPHSLLLCIGRSFADFIMDAYQHQTSFKVRARGLLKDSRKKE